MAQILIRDLDPWVVGKLKEQAVRNGRSLESELRIFLERESLLWALDEKAGRKPASRTRKRAARPRAR